MQRWNAEGLLCRAVEVAPSCGMSKAPPLIKRFRVETTENGLYRSVCALVQLMSPPAADAMTPEALTAVVHVQATLKTLLSVSV
jgi:hypothetical protein